jgi:hypothetical protein
VRDSLSAMMRAMMSGGEPAGCDRMSLGGLAGQDWALAGPNAPSRVASNSTRMTVFIDVSLGVDFELNDAAGL